MSMGSRWSPGRQWPGLLLIGAALVLAGCKGSASGGAGTPAAPGSGSAAISGQPAPATSGPTAGTGSVAPTTAASSLCANTGAVSQVIIVRLYPIDKIPRSDSPAMPRPGLVTITNAADARKLAVAVCGLPIAPSEAVNCPIDLGTAVSLKFTAPAKPVWQVVIHTTGCQMVTGLIPPRTAARSPAFWALLGQLAGPLGISPSA